MTPRKTPAWADVLLTLWIGVVAVVFFGPIVGPMIGAEQWGRLVGLWTQLASLAYLMMLIIASISLALKYLRRKQNAPAEPRAIT